MALSANRSLKWGVSDDQEAYNVLTNVHIYKNAFVGWSGAAARPLVAGDIFLGLADTEENNTVNALGTGVGATGDRIVRVNREGILYSIAVTGAAAATDIGKTVYASDDGTLTLTASGNSKVGKITKYISSGVADVYFSANEVITASVPVNLGGNVTIATTGNTDFYWIAPVSGVIQNVDFSGVDVLAANDTNYITWSMTNLGQAGAGSTAIFAAATDASMTTKATGGTALAANTKRVMALSATLASRYVTQGDRILVRAAATGTLANTVTGSAYELTILPQ